MVAVELIEEYVKGSKFRFEKQGLEGLLSTNHIKRTKKVSAKEPDLGLFQDLAPVTGRSK